MNLLRARLRLIERVYVELGQVGPAGDLVMGEQEQRPVIQHPLQLGVLLLTNVPGEHCYGLVTSKPQVSPEV